MVVILDVAGAVVEIAAPWPGVAVGAIYLDCIEHAIGKISDAHRSDLSRAVKEVLSGATFHASVDLRCDVEGMPIWFRIVATPRSIGVRAGTVLTHTSISDEKEREVHLNDVERRLNEIYSIAEIGDFEYVAAEDRTRLSPPVLRMFG